VRPGNAFARPTAVDDPQCRAAADLAERYALRGFDSVHVACFLEVAVNTAPTPTVFSTFDARLARAARAAAARALG
jgi:hypothetical protein